MSSQKEIPLENHLVLENIFSFLNVSALKQVRLVNKLWYEISTPILYENSCVHLTLKKLGKFNESIFPSSTLTSKKFQNFALYFFEFAQFAELDQNIKLFLETYCLHLKELTLSKTTFENSDVFSEMIERFLNMQTLVLGSVVNKNPLEKSKRTEMFTPNRNVKTLELTFGSNEKIIICWKQLFQMFPATESLNAQCRTSHDIAELLEALNTNSAVQLKTFSSFLTSFNNENLKSLSMLNYKFETLDLNVSGTKAATSPLSNLLKNSYQTLKDLKIFHDLSQEVPVNLNFSSKVNNLKKLDLVGDMITSLNFIDNLPNLEKLTVLHDHDEDEPQYLPILENSDFEIVNVHTKMNSFFLEYRVSECTVQILSQKMPNLKELSTYMDDESIQFVYKYMNTLETLNIFGTEISDEGITGIQIHILLNNAIRFKKAYRDHRNYIGDMKGLLKFCLKSELQENISDFAVRYGFIDLPKLRYLEIPGSAISNEGIAKLKGKPSVQNICADYFVEDGKLFKRKYLE